MLLYIHLCVSLSLSLSFLQSFSLRREFSHSSAHANNKEGRNVYFTLSFAGVALVAAIFVGIAVAKWRTARSPHAQGFIEVDQVSTIYSRHSYEL